jgi:hypothetical protein
MEIGTSSKATSASPPIFGFKPKKQHVVTTKLVSPLRGGTCLEFIPLRVQTFIVHVDVTSGPIEGSVEFVKD